VHDESIRDPLVSYRLGAVRVGLQATVLALLLLVLFRLIPGHGPIPTRQYVIILTLAAAGALGVRLLPWSRLFSSGHGMHALYVWSILDILLITAVIASMGRTSPELFLLYALTTVFFGAAYPPRPQIGLLAFTFACYLSALAISGWHIGLAVVILECGILCIVALLVSYLSAALLRVIASLGEARDTAERSASLLATVAGSARSMTLDSDAAMESVVDSVVALGFDAAALCGFDHEAVSFSVSYHRGLPAEYIDAVHDATGDMPGLVRQNGATRILDTEHPRPDGVPIPILDHGFDVAIASPVWVDGWLAAALVGASRDRRLISPPDVEAFELLSAQAGLALDNARRFEETLHSVEQLEELDRLKDDFLATASHEIRTPLTVILGSGLTLEQRWTELTDDLRLELVTGLNRNAKALDGLVSSLLDFARLGADTLHLNTDAVALDELVRNAAERLHPLFSDRFLEVDAADHLVVNADAALLDRALDNLLSNAAKHTAPGARVRASVSSDDDLAVVSVADDGPGIPAEDVRHLGERFFRGGDVNARSSKGLGLGLALVREILELHGTHLEVESTLGAGSRFSFSLPRLSEAADAARQVFDPFRTTVT